LRAWASKTLDATDDEPVIDIIDADEPLIEVDDDLYRQAMAAWARRARHPLNAEPTFDGDAAQLARMVGEVVREGIRDMAATETRRALNRLRGRLDD
jgi:hypothetical protein